MSSSKREGYRRRSKHSNHQQQNQTDIHSNLKPILNQEDEQIHQTSESSRHFEQRDPQNRRNFRRGYRKGRAKPHFVNNNEDSAGGLDSKLNLDPKYEINLEESVSGSNPKLEFESNCNEKIGKDEGSSSGSGSKLFVDYSEPELCIDEKVEELRTDQALVTSDDIDEHDDDPFKRLLELRMSLEEAELSNELLSMNNQLQDDELLAMESIYGENAFILDNIDGLRCFQINIHVEVPKGLQVSTKLAVDSSKDLSYSFEIEYLAPIILTCLLPRSYPSDSAPLFVVSVQWLNLEKVSSICHKLDSIWLEQAGQEVIYQWVDWIQNYTFSHLGFEHEIILGPYDVKHDLDRRAISESVSPDIDVPSMKAYNVEQCYEHFCRNIQECCICYSEYPGSQFIKLPCEHFFCQKCLKTFSDIHILEGTVMKMQCPEPKCEGVIPPSLLKRLVGDEGFERWESMMLERTLDSMSDVVYCPRCEMACLVDEDSSAQCTRCYYSFCIHCGERLHIGDTCMPSDTKILQKLQSLRTYESKAKLVEIDKVNQMLSLHTISQLAIQCPTCGMAISKTDGCNKMTCRNCGGYFCNLCGKAISGYDHFGSGAGKCQLFPRDEIENWERMMNNNNNNNIVGVPREFVYNGTNHPCPGCHFVNTKFRKNNHIVCQSCGLDYCYLCRKSVNRISNKHFGPNGCSRRADKKK